MPHPQIDNQTPFAFEPLIVTNEQGHPLLAPIVKGSFRLSTGEVLPEEEQCEIEFAGQFWGEPETSSYKYEPETAFFKPFTDIVLIGHAYAPSVGAKQVDVTLQLGDLQKTVRVVGDRLWVKRLGITDMTSPLPFEKIPLIYERAFGGWDSEEPDPLTSRFEPRNPVGVGFKRRVYTEGMRLPNLEDPKRPLKLYGDAPPPAGFGFISPHWHPRSAWAGTYDEAWQKNTAPRLPSDFDARFFNAASPGLVAPRYLQGNEAGLLQHVSPKGPITFKLPGILAPSIRVQLRGGKDARLTTNLDTVIINADEDLLILLWRTNLVLPSGPHDLVAMEIRSKNAVCHAALSGS